jgi:hypothetical protein
MEIIMKKLALVIAVTALIAEPLVLAVPAFATRAREAISGCVAPRCSWRLDADGGVLIGVKGGKGGVIYCPPQNGVCFVVRTAPLGIDPFNNNQGRNGGSNGNSIQLAGSPPGGPSFL